MLVAVHGSGGAELATEVAEVAAAVAATVAVEGLGIEPLQGDADAVVGMGLGGEVGHHHQPAPRGAFAAHETNH